LGDGTMDDHLTPVEPLDLPNAAAVSTGQGHACALTLGDRIFCWGLNLSGQLGVGPEGARPFPAEVVFE
ncbi:MAG TPA: RCC1 repeat-containing protein, partial [Myxococcales bacterium]|nr:RCC1 repeat-containing protein [Myxococcales bacterium]